MAMYEELVVFCEKYCFGNSENFTICSEIKYIDCKMYPKRILDVQYLVPATVLLTCIFLSGLLGNLSVCYVILKHPGMRSETNVYLFSLAISDLLLLIFGLPPELWYYWEMYPYVLGEFMCRFSNFMAATGTWASVLTIVAFSIERYDAVCRPLCSRWLGDKQVAIVICAIWTISAGTSLPIWHVYQIVMTPYPGTGKESLFSQACFVPDVEDYKYYGYWRIFSIVVFFFIPMVILAVVYIIIAFTLMSNRRLSRDCGIQNNCSENRRTFKVLVAVVLAFFICGAPLHYQRVFNSSTEEYRSMEVMDRDRVVLVATGVFYYFSATINPIIYNAMSKRYRKAFMETIWAKAVHRMHNDITPMNVIRDNETSKKTETIITTLIK